MRVICLETVPLSPRGFRAWESVGGGVGGTTFRFPDFPKRRLAAKAGGGAKGLATHSLFRNVCLNKYVMMMMMCSLSSPANYFKNIKNRLLRHPYLHISVVFS